MKKGKLNFKVQKTVFERAVFLLGLNYVCHPCGGRDPLLQFNFIILTNLIAKFCLTKQIAFARFSKFIVAMDSCLRRNDSVQVCFINLTLINQIII